MDGRHPSLARGAFAISAAFSLLCVVFLVLAFEVPSLPNEFGPKGFAVAFAMSFGVVGVVVASRRPENPIGWIFCALGVIGGLMALGVEYARWALLVENGDPPAGRYAAWIQEWLWIPLIAGLGLVAALFPDGRFRSAAWRRATVFSTALVAIPTMLAALIPELTIYEGYDNPVGLDGAWVADASEITIMLILPVLVLGMANAISRFRRARGDERQQLKWLVLSMAVIVAMLTIYGVIAVLFHSGANPSDLEWAEWGMIIGFVSVPVSIAFGVLKYRLYDIDIVINKAVVYGALAVFITIVYVAIVVGVGAAVGSQGSAVLSAAAAAIVALVFQPARRWAQRFANRVVYGERATPYEVLSELTSRFAGTFSLDDALPRLARVTNDAVGGERTRVWLRRGGELHVSAVWPAGADVGAFPAGAVAREIQTLDGDPAVLVRHQGDVLGAISVRMPANEALGAPQHKLLEDVAAHAGLVLRNVSLLEDLRASRKRIVAAQDDRARALERNIHDGAQQQLVALAVKLRLAQSLILKDAAKVEAMLGELQADATSALEDLRDLARGIYPPLLADKGLRVALEAQARKASIPVRVDGDGIGRHPPEIESTVYFCMLEALQNIAKYADASAVDIRLTQRDDLIEFSVRDDGRGFDPARTARGAGLQNMSDRLAAIDGSLDVDSTLSVGTTIVGRIHVRAES
jgi:signal transduction histidine kinase